MTPDTRVRPCVPDDADALALLGQATFLETFAGVLDGADILRHCNTQHSSQAYRIWLDDGRSRLWMGETRSGLTGVGYLLLTTPDLPVADPRKDDLEIKRVYLLHRFHGGGLGKRLMKTAVDHAVKVGSHRLLLGVYSGNSNAIAFYERLGFVRLATRKFRVGHHEYDDLVLGLELRQ